MGYIARARWVSVVPSAILSETNTYCLTYSAQDLGGNVLDVSCLRLSLLSDWVVNAKFVGRNGATAEIGVEWLHAKHGCAETMKQIYHTTLWTCPKLTTSLLGCSLVTTRRRFHQCRDLSHYHRGSYGKLLVLLYHSTRCLALFYPFCHARQKGVRLGFSYRTTMIYSFAFNPFHCYFASLCHLLRAVLTDDDWHSDLLHQPFTVQGVELKLHTW